MAIDPLLITTIPANELPIADITDESIILHAIGEVLYRTSLLDLAKNVKTTINYAPYEVKTLWVDNNYISANFETNGLGKNLWLGWQRMNGDRGTCDMNGSTFIGYGSTYNTAKVPVGENSKYILKGNLPNLTIPTNTNLAFGSGDGVSRQRVAIEPSGIGNRIEIPANAGDSFNVMQKSYVFLIIMKLP